ncbi:MAG: TonB-dependent receptor [Sulfurimonas sp.]
MKIQMLPLSLIAALGIQSTSAETVELDAIFVSSDLRETSEKDMAVSTTIKEEASLQDQGATHFEEVILGIPNVNFSGQTSRPRHIQIRGMGERDEYTGAPNTSVGFAMDGIDFSGIGMVGTLFDTRQIEVLRGPQGTRYGASALAGLINIQSNDPTSTTEGMIEVTGGEDELTEFGAVISGPFSEKEGSPLYRLMIQKHDSNGFRDNAFSGRDDTNGRDELNIRGKLRFTPNSDTTVDLTLIHSNLDNGYDAWSLDNSFTTLSDEPGEDSQKTNAAALKIKSTANKNFDFISTTTISDSDMTYRYDGDWVYPGYYESYPTFRYLYSNDKKHKTLSQEFRLVSTEESKLFNDTTEWLLGLYAAQMKEENRVNEFGDDPWYGAWSDSLDSEYEVNKFALFGQLNYHINDKTVLSTGLRVEKHTSEYTNNYWAGAESYSPDDFLFGGHIELTHTLDKEKTLYASISQGNKAGGFNIKVADPTLLYFKKETATNYEIGLKTQNNHLKTRISAFYTDRKNPQFDGYTYIGAAYTYYTENFDNAENYGLEGEFDWRINSSWNLFGSLGLLKTTVEGVSLSGAYSIDGREQPHAPNYQFSIGAQYRHDSGFFARVSTRGMDEFYFSNSHNEKSEAYTVTDARIGYEAESWEVYLWGKNLLDEKYATRGYYFANEPNYAAVDRYIRLGAPRQIGITARYHF